MHSTTTNASQPPDAQATDQVQDGAASVDGRAARWRGHRASRRAALANEARKAVHRLGAEASMDDLANALGTSKSILYRYFTDKTGLQHAVGEVVVTRMLDALVEASHTSATPRENLRAVIGVYLEMVEGSPTVYTFVTQVPAGSQNGGSSPLSSFLGAVSARVVAPIGVALLREQQPEGEASEAELLLAAQTWAAGVVGFVRGAGDRWLATPPEARPHDRHALTDEVTAWLWTGVAGLTRTVDLSSREPSLVVDTVVGHRHQQEKP